MATSVEDLTEVVFEMVCAVRPALARVLLSGLVIYSVVSAISAARTCLAPLLRWLLAGAWNSSRPVGEVIPRVVEVYTTCGGVERVILGPPG